MENQEYLNENNEEENKMGEIQRPYITVNGAHISINELIYLRLTDEETKLSMGIKASVDKKLINACKNKPVNVKFYQVPDEQGGEMVIILDVSSSDVTCYMDHAGTMFSEKMEMTLSNPATPE